MLPFPRLPLGASCPAEAELVGQAVGPFCVAFFQPIAFKSLLCAGEGAGQTEWPREACSPTSMHSSISDLPVRPRAGFPFSGPQLPRLEVVDTPLGL